MMVDPAYQRMGAGRMLVKWGLAEAEKMGVDVRLKTDLHETTLLIILGNR
jgi:GNAT superfamily N-acetyltransferase